ncbi:Glycosyltransferase Family 1 protein [Trametes cinnabarina]|uniref:Glycosyltransferase Family 1 protein n=1 Tax=Pycnoporus cinnabarinus TaxID=5643 RepID=A0A060SAV0_PYCCI|nr:Glycosyltransferase Family 1 protein [Trametes cinnabarina]
MTLTVQPSKHLLVVPVHMWGHTRPLCIAAARMAKTCPSLALTVCIASGMYDRAKTEMMRDFAPDEKEPLSRIRMVSIYEGRSMLDPEALVSNFLAVWNKLSSGESVSATSLDGAEHAINLRDAPLNAVLVDDTWPLAESIAEREGISFNDAAYSVSVIVDRYRHENPSSSPFDVALGADLRSYEGPFGGVRLHASDVRLRVFTARTTVTMRKWLGETGRKIYYAGPLVANGDAELKSGETARREDDGAANGRPAEHGQQGVLAFMDEQLKKRGERSVIYVSFGSMLWPLDPAKLVAALEVMMEQNIPLALTRPSPFARLPEDFLKRLEEYGDAIIADWVPQQALLHHRAMGWCLTHGGHNTVLECLTAAVPMIVWPIVMDQPTNAVHLTDDLNVAYELLEVRHGHGLGRIYRTGYTPVGTVEAVRNEVRDVLTRAFGADGEAKRGRVAELKDRLSDAWRKVGGGEKEEAGIGRREVEAFLEDVCARVPFTGGVVGVAAS